MKTLRSLTQFLAVPLIALNMLGGLVSGVWLASLGEWTTIGYGLLTLIVAPRFLSWSLRLPSPFFPRPMDSLSRRGKTLLTIVAASLSSIYRLALMTTWCCGIFFIFMLGEDGSNFILRLIWSYGIAIGPWGFLASKERDNFASAISTFLAELAYITLMLFALYTPVNLFDALKIFAVFMVIASALELFVAVTTDGEQKRLGAQSAPAT